MFSDWINLFFGWCALFFVIYHANFLFTFAILWKKAGFHISHNVENNLFYIGEIFRAIAIFGSIVCTFVIFESSNILTCGSGFIIILAALLKNNYKCEL